MDKQYTDEQRQINLGTTTKLKSIIEGTPEELEYQKINKRLSAIDREILILQAESRDLYLARAKLKQKQKHKRVGHYK